MESRSVEVRCQITPLEKDLVEFAFGEGCKKAVIYARKRSTTLVYENQGKVEGSKQGGSIGELAQALVEWCHEQVHGADSKISS